MNFSFLFSSLFFWISSYSQQSPDLKLNLFFDVDKYDLTKEHLLLIDSAISSKNMAVISIKGFADSTGNGAYNMDLSQKRALTVFRYFANRHYSDSMIIDYFGEQLASGQESHYNRRVEIWYKEKITKKINGPDANKNRDILAVVEKYELNNIYFIPDKAIIDPLSFNAIDDAVKYLKKFPGCHFEIIGHVNYVMLASVTNNPKAVEPAQKLSQERAKLVYDLLAEKGIPIQQMTHKGVGNSQMVFKNPKSEEEKRKNMRVEILILCNK